MSTNIKALVKSFTVERGVEDLISAGSFVMSNADGSYIGDWTGDVEIDRMIKISTGYQAGGDALALFATGLISGVADQQNAGDFSEEVNVTLMSLFKSFRKMKITTSTLSGTGQAVLNLLMTTYMPGVAYNFTACAGTTFLPFRVEEEMFTDAVQKIAEASKCELFWSVGGVLTAVAFPDPDGAPVHTYGLDDFSGFTKGDAVDIGAVNTLKVRGRKRRLAELPIELIASQVFDKGLFYDTTVGTVIRRTLLVPFGAGKATNISIESSDSTYFTYDILSVTEEACQVIATRILAGTPATDITIEVWGTKYSDDDSQFYVGADVQDANMLTLFGGVPMNDEYENKYIQSDADCETIGTWILLKNYLSMIPGNFLAPHNKALTPNDILTLTTLAGDVQFVVRKISTSFNSGDYSLADNIEGWCVPATGT